MTLSRLTLLVVSCAVLGVGVALLLTPALGSDGYSTLINGLTIATGVPFFVLNIVVAVLFIALAWWKGAKPGIGTVVQPVVTGIVVNLGLELFVSPTELLGRILVFALGFVVVTLGVAGYLTAKAGAGPAEALSIAWDPPIPFRWSYSLFQAAGALVGWLLGAALGVGTIVVVLAIGPVVDLVERQLQRRLPASWQ